MRSSRPLKFPRDIGAASCLNALFSDICNPLRVESNSLESIRLENTEGDQCSKSTCNKANNDQSPIIRRPRTQFIVRMFNPAAILRFYKRHIALRLPDKVTKNERSRKQNGERRNVNLGCHRHTECKSKTDAEEEEWISN